QREHGAHGCGRVEVAAAGVAVVEAAVQVEAHAPGGLIAVPVAAADERVAARGVLGAPNPAYEPRADPAREQRARHLGGGAAQAIDHGSTRKLVAALRRRSDTMMRQQILVAVDADEILERERNARLLVRLELGE